MSAPEIVPTPSVPPFNGDVFINCPWDPGFRPLFDALVFAVLHCGYFPRSAMEAQGSGRQRFDRIVQIVRECPLGIHDLSRTELTGRHRLPRFNMPFELGLYLGAREFGDSDQQRKDFLVLEAKKGRSVKACTDLGGVDPLCHLGDPKRATVHVRDWLNGRSGGGLAGPKQIKQDYESFRADLPGILKIWQVKLIELTFADFRKAASTWLRARPQDFER